MTLGRSRRVRAAAPITILLEEDLCIEPHGSSPWRRRPRHWWSRAAAQTTTPLERAPARPTHPGRREDGQVGVLLPDTKSSVRYETVDRPFLTKAFGDAGVDGRYPNAQGDTSAQIQEAEQAITNGAKVLLLDALDSGTGAAIESNAKSQGVKVIDYDRLVLKGSADYYVSFDNTEVGKLQGEGLVACLAASSPGRASRCSTAPRPTTTRRCSSRARTPCSTRSSPPAPTRRSPSRRCPTGTTSRR